MGLAEDFDAMVVDHLYENEIKPLVDRANQIVKRAAGRVSPGRTGAGDIAGNSYAFLTDDSDENRATVRVVSDPKKPGRIRGRTLPDTPGNVDHANFVNARTGYFDGAVAEIEGLFR